MSEDRPVMYRKPSWSMWPEIAGPEPAIPERFRVRLGVVVVAREHRRAADADLARLERRQLAALLVLDRDLHPGALDSRTFRPLTVGVSSASCRAGGRTVMFPVTSPSPKYWTSTLPSFRSACFWSSRYMGAPA